MTIGQLISNTQKINLREVVGDALDATKKNLVKFQKQQLLHGERADGKKIGKYKSKAYAAKKNAQNPLPGLGFMDWKLTGDLHSEVFADVREDKVVFDSADSKTGFLIKRLGDPFGLNPESVSEYVPQSLAPVSNTMIKEKIHHV